MKRQLRMMALLAALGILCIPAAAYEVPTDFTDLTLEAAMENFRAAYGLHEGNFSLSYYDTVTGEAYTYNDGKFMVAASTFKLPLNMYYYELERDGQIAADAYISGAGTTLDQAHYQSLVHSNNEVSIGMLYNLGDFRTYKALMRKYFTMTDEEIDYIYYVDNYYCTRMMMDALTYLYDNSGDFEEMLGYMKEAQPGEYFKAYVTEYEIAHKYGWFEGAVNDVGIIYTPQPFLLAVYTQDAPDSAVCGRAAELLTAYNLSQTPVEADSVSLELQPVPETAAEEAAEEAVPVEAAPEPEPEPEPEPAPEPEPETEPEQQSAFEWWMAAVALGVFLLGGGLTLLLLRPERLKKKYENRHGDWISKE